VKFLVKVDVEAEKKQIFELNQKWYRLETDKQLDAVMDLMTEDVILQASDMPSISGKPEVRKLFAEMFKTMISSRGGPVRIEVSVSGDLAYDIGNTKSSWMGLGGKPVEVDVLRVASVTINRLIEVPFSQ
jgi:ketosteroid isomerase-like protein